MSIVIVWQSRGIDLSLGTTHEVLGYCCLLMAGLLLMSMDVFLSFILAPVPDVRPSGPAGIYRNPFTFLWNESLIVKWAQDDTTTNADGTPERPQPR